MVGAAEAHDAPFARVVAGEPHRLHHRLRARHVERDLVLSGNFLQPPDVLQHDRVITTQHRTKIPGARPTFVDAGFVEIIAEDVDAVGAREIDAAVAVQVHQFGSLGARPEGTERQVLAQHRHELEGHAIGRGELQIRQPFARLRGSGERLRAALAQRLAEPLQRPAPTLCDIRRRPIYSKETQRVIAVAGQPTRQPRGHASMSGERGMLRQGKTQPLRHQGYENQCGRCDRNLCRFYEHGTTPHCAGRRRFSHLLYQRDLTES